MANLGHIFGESILRSKKRVNSQSDEYEGSKFYRFYFFLSLLIIGFGILSIRLFSLTAISGTTYKKLASENRIREINLPSPRGIIYDRNKNPLVRNIPVFITEEGELFYSKPGDQEKYRESSTREYVYGEAFGNLLGFTGEVDEYDLRKLAESKDKNNIRPFKLADIIGKMGLEEQFHATLRGRDGKDMSESDAQQ